MTWLDLRSVSRAPALLAGLVLEIAGAIVFLSAFKFSLVWGTGSSTNPSVAVPGVALCCLAGPLTVFIVRHHRWMSIGGLVVVAALALGFVVALMTRTWAYGILAGSVIHLSPALAPVGNERLKFEGRLG